MRNRVLDGEKAIAAYFVVFLHIRFPGITGELVNAVARFAVPLFFMISGYFCFQEKGEIRKRLPGKIRHSGILCVQGLLVYLIWQMAVCIGQGKSPASWLLGLCDRRLLKEFLLYNNTSPIKWHLWFLPALLYCYLLFWVVERFRVQRAAGLLIPVLLLFHFLMEEGAVFTGREYRIMEFRNYLFTGFPFFMTGYWIHRKERLIKKYIRPGALLTGIGTGVVLSLTEYRLAGRMELFIGSVVLAVSLFLFAVFQTVKKVPEWIAEIGNRHSFFIYLFHIGAADVLKWCAQETGLWGSSFYAWLHPLLTAFLTTILAMGIFMARHKKIPCS